MDDSTAGTHNFVSQWRTQQETRDCADQALDPGIPWRSVQRVANKRDQQTAGYYDDDDVGSIYANEAAPRWLSWTCAIDRRKYVNAVAESVDEHGDHGNSGYSSDTSRAAKSFTIRARPQSASASRPSISRGAAAAVAGQLDFVSAKSRIRLQSATLQRSQEPEPIRDKSLLPEQIKDSKWTEMMFRSPDFQQRNLIRLEQETYELLQSVFRKERAVQVSKLSQQGGNTANRSSKREKKQSTTKQTSARNSAARKSTKASEAKKRQVNCVPNGVSCGSGMQLVRDRKQYPTCEYVSSKYDVKPPRSQQSVALASHNQMEMGDGTARNTQTPRQLARMKPVTKNATTKDLRSEKADRHGKKRDEAKDEAVRNRVLEELGWALDEDEPVKVKKKKPPHDVESCNTPPKQPNQCSISVGESQQATKPVSETASSKKLSHVHMRQRTAPKKSAQCPASAPVEATAQKSTWSKDEFDPMPAPESEKDNDPALLLQLDVEQCRHPPSQEEEPETFDSEVRRNSTFGDEFHRQQILDDLDSLPTVSRRTTNVALSRNLISTPAGIETRASLDVDLPDLENATLVSHVDSDAKTVEQDLRSLQQAEEEESNVKDTPAIAPNSEAVSVSPLEIQVEEDEQKQPKFRNHQVASEERSRALKNNELTPAPVCDNPQGELLLGPLQEVDNRVTDVDEGPSSECEQVRNSGDRTEITSLGDKIYAPDPVVAELISPDSVVTACSDLELQPTEDHHQVILPEFREHEAVGGLVLTPVRQQESVQVIGEDSNLAEDMGFAFADDGGGGEMLQDHDSVSHDVPPVADEDMNKATEAGTVGSCTTASAGSAPSSEDDQMEKNNSIEETREEADGCHHYYQQQEQPDYSSDGQAMSPDLTVENDVEYGESGFSKSERLDSGAVSRDVVMLENEPPPHLNQSEFTSRTKKVDQVTDPMKNMEAATSEGSLDFLGTVLNVQPSVTDGDEEHAAQGMLSSAPIDGVYEDNVAETVLQKENDSEAVMTGSGADKQVQDQDTLQSVRGEFDFSQGQQPREIVENTSSHGKIECWEASLLAESSGELYPLRHNTAIDNGVNPSPAMDTAIDLKIGGMVTQIQARKTEVAARRIQRQYRCFVQRQVLADQLKFLVSQHRRQVRKKTRRASQKAAAVVALLAAVGGSLADPTASDVEHPSSSSPSLEPEQHGDVKVDMLQIDAQASTIQVGSENQHQKRGAGSETSSESMPTPAIGLSMILPDATEELSLSEPKRELSIDTTVVDEASEALRMDDAIVAAPASLSSFLVSDNASHDGLATSATRSHCQVQGELFVPPEVSSVPSVHPTWSDELQPSSDDYETTSVAPGECFEEAFGAAFGTGDGTDDTYEPPPLALALLTSQDSLTTADAFEINSSEKAEVKSGLEADIGAMCISSATPISASTTATDQERPHPSNADHDARLRSRAASIALAALAFADDDDGNLDFGSNEHRLTTESEELTYEAEYLVAVGTASQSGLKELSSEQGDPANIHNWERYLDAVTNKLYYYNPSTQVSQWTPPEDAAQVIDRTAAENDSKGDVSAWSERAGLTASSLEEEDQAQLQRQQQEAWHQVREQSVLLESAGGWDKYLMTESATIFFYHKGCDEYFHNEDNRAPLEFSESKAQLLEELHQSLAAEQLQVGAADDPVMVDTGERYEADFVDNQENDDTDIAQWGLRRNLSQSAEKRGEWQTFVDTDSRQVFYYNARTGESTWEIPAVFQDPGITTATTGGQHMNDYQWVQYFDDTFGAAYYVNLATGETSWEKPDDFDDRAMTTTTTELLIHQELHETTETKGELQKRQHSHDDQTHDGGETQVDEEEGDYVIRIDEHSAEQLDELF